MVSLLLFALIVADADSLDGRGYASAWLHAPRRSRCSFTVSSNG